MVVNPILEEIRAYLSLHFQVAVAEPSLTGNYYVFTVLVRGISREVKFNPDYLVSSDALKHLDALDVEGITEASNAIFDPYRPSR